MKASKHQNLLINRWEQAIEYDQKQSVSMNKEADSDHTDPVNLKIIQSLLTAIQVAQFPLITAIMKIQVRRDFKTWNKTMIYLADPIRFQIKTQSGKLH